MNAKRRSSLKRLAERLDQAHAEVLELLEQLQDLRDEEREAFDNMPPSLQGSDRGQATEEHADRLDEAASELETGTDSMHAVLDQLRESLDQ